jgi:hypothetical protein
MFADELNIISTELRAVNAFAFGLKASVLVAARHAALARGVRHIVLGTTQKQMLRVDASGIVAFVTNHHSVSDWANEVFVREAIGKHLLSHATSEVDPDFKHWPLDVRAA